MCFAGRVTELVALRARGTKALQPHVGDEWVCPRSPGRRMGALFNVFSIQYGGEQVQDAVHVFPLRRVGVQTCLPQVGSVCCVGRTVDHVEQLLHFCCGQRCRLCGTVLVEDRVQGTRRQEWREQCHKGGLQDRAAVLSGQSEHRGRASRRLLLVVVPCQVVEARRQVRQNAKQTAHARHDIGGPVTEAELGAGCVPATPRMPGKIAERRREVMQEADPPGVTHRFVDVCEGGETQTSLGAQPLRLCVELGVQVPDRHRELAHQQAGSGPHIIAAGQVQQRLPCHLPPHWHNR